MSPELINKITNILAIVVALGTVVSDALGQVTPGSKWYVYLSAVVVALIFYFTGKSAVALKKKNQNLN